MRQEDLISVVAERAGLVKSDVRLIIKTMNDAITEALLKDDEVSLTGLGTFRITVKPSRQGRNPRTGEAITVPAKKLVKMQISANVKRAVAATL